jgi:hypothetical protein
VGGVLVAYGCDCCGRVQKFGSENIFQAGSYPEFDFILKSFRFLIFKIPGSRQKLSQNEIWQEDFFLNLSVPTRNF